MIVQIKSFLRDGLALPPDLILIVIGLITHILFCMLLRKPWYSASGLLGVLVLGILIEGYEIWVHYHKIGLFAPENDPLMVILLRHSWDIVKMLVFLMIVIILPLVKHSVGRT